MHFKSLSEEQIDELTKKADAFAKEWHAKGCPELTDEDLKGIYLNVEKYFPELNPICPCDGVPVPVAQRYNMEWCTVDDILSTENIETRRLLISEYGTHRFLRDGGAVAVTELDVRGYQIVKFPVDDTNWYFLRMINSTVEKKTTGQTRAGMVDGGYTDNGEKIYFLRLPKELVESGEITNEKAVAWSFNSKVKEGHIYNTGINQFIEKAREEDYVFKDDKREFSLQARQGDVHIRVLAKSMDDLLNGKLYTDNGYDPDSYAPDVES